MNQGKGFMEGLSVLPLAGFLSIAISATTFAQSVEKSADDLLLEQRVQAIAGEVADKKEVQASFSMADSISKLRIFKSTADSKVPACQDVTKKVFGKKYVLTFDAQNKPCRIYDLSFPNLQAMFTRKKATQIPVRMVSSKDYLNWLDGNMEALQQSNEEYKKYFNPRIAARNSWTSKLRFRNIPAAVPGSKSSLFDIGLPQSFSLADLDIGNRFRFDSRTMSELNQLIGQVKKSEMAYGLTESEGIASDYLIKVMNTPETLLQGIRFNWNDMDKVYDVILEADFLPIKGPVALVDYQRQYKYAVEKMFRSILSTGLYQLSRFIPNQVVSAAVEVLVDDAFEQLEMAYEYQMLQLEDALKTIAADEKSPLAAEIAPNYALNLLYGFILHLSCSSAKRV